MRDTGDHSNATGFRGCRFLFVSGPMDVASQFPSPGRWKASVVGSLVPVNWCYVGYLAWNGFGLKSVTDDVFSFFSFLFF